MSFVLHVDRCWNDSGLILMHVIWAVQNFSVVYSMEDDVCVFHGSLWFGL